MPVAMQCPCCHHRTLATTHYEGHHIDICRHCGGMWFDHHQLDAVLSAFDNGDDNVRYREHLGKGLGTSQRACPCCQQTMKHYHLLRDFHVEIDICERCDGAWIDHDELEEVKHSPRIRDVIQDLNQGVNWKTWVFQFLSQMPVEYNLKPSRQPLVTWWLIALNALIFVSYAFNPSVGNAVIELFASRPSDLAQGQHLWSPLTAIFLHGGVMHLLGNLYFLYIIGDNLEDVLGHWRYLGLYLLCGLGASLISVAMNWGSDIPSVGASGAIAGLFAMYMVWYRHASLTFMFVVYQKKLAPVWFFGIWLLLNLVGMLLQGEGVDYWAHLGGFAIGLGLAYGLKPQVLAANPLLGILSSAKLRVSR